LGEQLKSQISRAVRLVLAAFCLCLGCSLPIGSALRPEDQANLQRGELALARGEFAPAVTAFDRVLAGNPNDLRALLGSARANLGLGRVPAFLALFDAYRERADGASEVSQREYCSAIAMAAEQSIESRQSVGRAPELIQRLESENCADDLTPVLMLHSGLEVAERAIEHGQNARALEIYLSLVSSGPDSKPEIDTLPGAEASAIALAYLAAVDILVIQERREEALALLSGGLAKFPNNRDLVHRMVTLLADGASVVFPRAKPPEKSRPVVSE
jgi:tetratricopeptide (TPR) repeat protein